MFYICEMIIFYFRHLSEHSSLVLDSERSDECVDFTIMLLFCTLSMYTIWSQNNASIFNFGILFDGKVNLVVLPSSFQKRRENQKNLKEKKTGSFYAKSVFDKIDFVFWCNPKKNDRRYMTFSLNVCISIFYTR